MAEGNHGKLSVELMIYSYAAKYEQLFPADLDLEKVWEISEERVSSIAISEQEASSSRDLLSRLLFDVSATTWTRSFAGAILLNGYRLHHEEDIAIRQLLDILAPASLGDPSSAVKEKSEIVSAYVAMISLYALNIISKVEQKDLLLEVIVSCLKILESYSTPLSSKEEDCNERICVNILSTLLTRGTQINGSLCAVVEENAIFLLEKFFSFLSEMTTSLSTLRERIAKRLITPLLQLLGKKNPSEGVTAQLINYTWAQCLLLAGSNEKDYETSSSILCILMSLSNLKPMARLGREDLWDFLSQCFLTSKSVVRKRAAFIMNLIPNSTHKQNLESVDKEIDVKKSGKKLGKPKKNKNGNDSVAVESVGAAPIIEDSYNGLPAVLDSLSGKNTWWADFLDVYGQIEGCTSMHLIDQIWPQLKHLCYLAAAAAADTEAVADSNSAPITDEFRFPVVKFVWIKALLHILLQISIPGIRKAVFRRILQGGAEDRMLGCSEGLQFSASRRSIHWFCTELLPLVDTVNFFSAYFIPLGEDVGCEDGSRAPSQDSKINFLAHPGILMPSFLARYIKCLASKDRITNIVSESLVAYLIRSLIHALCGENGLHSLSAVKWILRAFSESSVLSLIPRCLGLLEIRDIGAFLRGRLACSNGVVREHVLEGFVPLFLKGVDSTAVSLSDLLLMVTDAHCFGLERIVTCSKNFALFREVVYSSCTFTMVDEKAGFKALQDMDGHLLTIAYTVVSDYMNKLNRRYLPEDSRSGLTVHSDDTDDVQDTLEVHCQAYLDVMPSLYTDPYYEMETQLKTLRHLSGITRTMSIAHSMGQLRQSPNTSSAQRMIFPLIRFVCDCSVLLSSYLATALVSCLTSSAQQSSIIAKDKDTDDDSDEDTFDDISYMPPRLILTVGLMDECASMLGTLLLAPRHCEEHHIPPTDKSPPLQGIKSALLKGVVITMDNIQKVMSSSPPSSVSNVLAVKCLSSLLNALHYAWPLTGIDEDIIEHLVTSTSNATSLLISMQEPSATLFRSIISSSDSVYPSSNQESVVLDLARITDYQFGRLSTMFVENRWAGIRAGLELTVLVNKNTKGLLCNSEEGGYKLFSLALDQLDSCTMLSLPDILDCCLAVTRRMCSTDEDDEKREKRAGLILRLLDVAWQTSTGGSVYTDVRAINSFVRLAFDVSVLRTLDHSDVIISFDKVEALGLNNRPHIMFSLVAALCAAWSSSPELSIPFFSLMPRLLLYREPKQDDHNIPDKIGQDNGQTSDSTVDTKDPSPLDSIQGVCRFLVLTFLENCLKTESESAVSEDIKAEKQSQQNRSLSSCVDTLITDLMAMNRQEEFIHAAMIGSDLYGQKLRCWQSVCVLSRYVTEPLLAELLEMYFTTLTHSAGHSIRVHVELFGAAMAIRFPSVMMPRLLLALREYNHSQQTLCSIFVVLGHAVFYDPTHSPATATAGAPDAPVEASKTSCSQADSRRITVDVATAQDIVNHLLPWIACGAGLPRSVAQLLMHSLIPAVLANKTPEAPGKEVKFPDGDAYLRNILRYLEENRDSSKGMPKQRKFFSDFNPTSHCSVMGLALIGLDGSGEVVAPHILNLLADNLKEEVELEREKKKEGSKVIENFPSPSILSDTVDVTANTLQTKRVPFDELQLNLQSEALSRQQNAAGRKRQEVVICASLIDKVTNLAGIARTCEIFAVQELVLASLGVVQSDTFQGIAVSCDQWLPMREVPVHALSVYLSGMRRKGYTILGLEQTDSSIDLGCVTEMPSKCVLLLGREKEGIPVELLQEVDCCMEIPQYGVIRSLNVHVSAALAIWEITKHNKQFIADSNLNITGT